MRIGFMSSVAPHWNLDQIIAAANQYGFSALEPRVEWGHAMGLELATSKVQRREARQKLADAGLSLSCLALGTRFAKATEAEREASVEQVARYSELAADLGAPLLRIFGGPIPEGRTMADLRDEVGVAIGKAAARAAAFGVTPCLETHDHFSNPVDVAHVVKVANHPNVGVVWHANHHLRLGMSIPDAYELLRPYLRHCHINEGLAVGQANPASGPIPLGSGDQNVAEVARVLKASGFTGVLSWEWINGGLVGGKPDLASIVDPHAFLAQYAGKLQEYLAA